MSDAIGSSTHVLTITVSLGSISMPRPTLEQIEANTASVTRRLSTAGRIALGVFIMLVAAGAGMAVVGLRPGANHENLGQLGSYFAGTTGIVWALGATVAVLMALLAQQRQIVQQQLDLAYSREDIALQHQALEGQRSELALQTRTFQRQQFEATFFELLRSHTDLVAQFDYSEREDTIRGVDAVTRAGYFIFDLRHIGFDPAAYSGDDAVGLYASLYANHEQILGPYFRSLYHVLKYVDQAPDSIVVGEERRWYASIVRARLSAKELRLLFYNGLSEYGTKMKPLIERYALLEHIPTSAILNPAHRTLYLPAAFGVTGTHVLNQPSTAVDHSQAV